MKKDFMLLLKEELSTLKDAKNILVYSRDSCAEIGHKDIYSFSELDKLESYTGRFARISDILIQKTFRLIDKIDLEDLGTVRDRINRAEKKGLIGSAEMFTDIRILRNDIAHEYLPEALAIIFKKVSEYTPPLLDSIERVFIYCKKYNLK